MPSSKPEPSPSLVRRIVSAGQVREFLHPADGSPPRERPAGESALSSDAQDGALEPAQSGQLLWRDIAPEELALPLRLPLFRGSCDSSGACCGLHHQVPVTEPERERILALMSTGWEAPAALEVLVHRAFDSGPDTSFNIATVDGSCAFHRGDALCEIHVRAGPMSKPMACRSFPSNLVLCGEEWHGSLRPECACLQRTAIEGAELHLQEELWVALRNYQQQVACVPELLRLDASRTIPRDEYLQWMRALVDELRATFEPIHALRAAAARLDGVGSGQLARLDSRPPQAWLDGVVAWLERWLATLGPAYQSGSPYAAGLRWAFEVATELASSDWTAPPTWSKGRVRDWNCRQASLAGLFLQGHGLLEFPALQAAAHDLGHLCWLARAAATFRPVSELDPRLESCSVWLFLWRTLDGRPGEQER